MAKVLVLYYSMYGHIETMAAEVAQGARSVAGTQVTVKRVPETMPADAFKGAGGKLEQAADMATPAELAAGLRSIVEHECRGFGLPAPRMSIEPGRALCAPPGTAPYPAGGH